VAEFVRISNLVLELPRNSDEFRYDAGKVRMRCPHPYRGEGGWLIAGSFCRAKVLPMEPEIDPELLNDPRFQRVLKDALEIQDRFSVEPIYAKTGKGYLKSEGGRETPRDQGQGEREQVVTHVTGSTVVETSSVVLCDLCASVFKMRGRISGWPD